ncbi:E3 ubiquitin-protein ligase TRIM38-like [Sorex araneus]|uniref:E3 ubiquitin-protein ligase TRIM38-like n=1 Tax=Sorex araneus TaxID=42254 RepID=UPI0003314DE2|nr:E3 ubiquitin-protein ligase TRIM38-like [Sorex araneus]
MLVSSLKEYDSNSVNDYKDSKQTVPFRCQYTFSAPPKLIQVLQRASSCSMYSISLERQSGVNSLDHDLPCVLECEAFHAGKGYFEIDFQKSSKWDVGVCRENVPRDNDIRRDPESGFWAFRHCKDDDYTALTTPITPLPLQSVINMGVFVDCEARLIFFYDVVTGSHIFTFPKASFPEPIRPYFCIDEDSDMCT